LIIRVIVVSLVDAMMMVFAFSDEDILELCGVLLVGDRRTEFGLRAKFLIFIS
jgi:hypothetical protein